MVNREEGATDERGWEQMPWRRGNKESRKSGNGTVEEGERLRLLSCGFAGLSRRTVSVQGKSGRIMVGRILGGVWVEGVGHGSDL